MSTPMFNSSYYYTQNASLMFDTQQWGAVVQQMSTTGNAYYDDYNESSAYYLRNQYEKKGMPILNMTARFLSETENEYVYIWTASPGAWFGLRNSEKSAGLASIEAVALNDTRQIEAYIEVNIRASFVYAAWMTIIKTLTVCIFLTICSMSFTKDFNQFI